MYDESAIEVYTTPSGLKRYRLPVVCAHMSKHRFVSSNLPEFAIHKATLQEMLWAEQWEERTALKHRKLGLEMNAKRPDLKIPQKKKIAEGRTEIAQLEASSAYRVLARGLENPVEFDWEFFKNCPEYPFPKPGQPNYPSPPAKPVLPREPNVNDLTFQPKLEPLDKLRPARKLQKEQEMHARFEAAHKKWEQICMQMRRMYQQQCAQYKDVGLKLKQQYQERLQIWEQGRSEYLRAREGCIQKVEQKKAAYLEHEPHAVLDYFDMALACSNYPTCFPHSFEMDYDAANRQLIIDYLLPPLRVLPRLTRVVYHEENNTFQEIIFTDDERNTLYARLLHELPLRTFHEIFNADGAVALASILFRGYIFLEENKEKGRAPTRVIEVHTDRATFATLDLYHSDPGAVFEEIGGVIRPLE